MQNRMENYRIVTNKEDNKIIFDTDLVYLCDDAYALFGLLKADELGYIDLLGVTTVGANHLVAPVTYDVLSILEYIDRTDIPVYMGSDVPLEGFWNVEEMFNTIGKMSFCGAYAYLDQYTNSYEKASELACTKLPGAKTSPQSQSAADFMIEQVHKYPGKVTIMAVGSCINVATAILKDPNFVKDAAGIVYMGGVFDVKAEDLDGIEVNWWYDPKAAQICLQQNWKSHITVPHDAAVTCKKGRDVYDRYKSKNTTKITNLIVNELAPIYEAGKEEALVYCWDPIVVATYLCPDLIEHQERRKVTICTQKGYAYAQCLSWEEKKAPKGLQSCDIIFKVNRDKFWDFMSDLYAQSPEKAQEISI